jgi:hypothetical protein
LFARGVYLFLRGFAHSLLWLEMDAAAIH